MTRRRTPMTWRQRAVVGWYLQLCAVSSFGAFNALGSGYPLIGTLSVVLAIACLAVASRTHATYRMRNEQQAGCAEVRRLIRQMREAGVAR